MKRGEGLDIWGVGEVFKTIHIYIVDAKVGLGSEIFIYGNGCSCSNIQYLTPFRVMGKR